MKKVFVLDIVLMLMLMCVPFSFSMVQPPKSPAASWNSLPADIKRYTFQFIASSNVYAVVETMKTLNATDKFCHAAMHSEDIVKSIMDRMPHLINQVYFIIRLSDRYDHVLKDKLCGNLNNLRVELRNGQELVDAVRANKREEIALLLKQEKINIDLPHYPFSATSLIYAIRKGDNPLAKALIEAGAWLYHECLTCAAIEKGDEKIVELLLKYGVALDIPFHEVEITNPKIIEMLVDARKKRKEKLRFLCGKKRVN